MGGAPQGIGQTVQILTRVLVAPGSNLKVAILLYATIAVFLLLLLVIGVMVIMSAPEDDTVDEGSSEVRNVVRAAPRSAVPVTPRRRLFVGLGLVAVLMAMWVAAGYTTSDSGMCKSCHWSTSQHAKAEKASDPHARTACVECHESGGVAGRYLTGVPYRALHLVMAWNRIRDDSGYGRVTSRACSSCHAASLSGTTTNAKRGLKMSHAEPLAAAARCLDCHTRRDGVVSVHNAGMKQCLRCHDGDKVSTACATCHEGRASAAARARTASFRAEQIQEVSCGGCHDEKKNCDPCHATRMPHSDAFKNGAHARAGVVDFWYNGGKGCGKCHTASRRPCGRCHTSMLGKAHGGSMAVSHQNTAASRCNTCHLEFASIATRDFCKDLCHTKAAIEASPR